MLVACKRGDYPKHGNSFRTDLIIVASKLSSNSLRYISSISLRLYLYKEFDLVFKKIH